MTTPQRWHCAWTACSRLYVKDRTVQSYCGHADCPATRVAPEHGPRTARASHLTLEAPR